MASATLPCVPNGAMGRSFESAGLRQYLDRSRPSRALCIIGQSQVHADIADLIEQHLQQTQTLKVTLVRLKTAEALAKRKEKNQTNTTNKGVLKTAWCIKHREDVFGCTLSVIDIDAFTSKESFEAAAESQLDALRVHLRGRNTRQAVVVVTKADRFPFYDKTETAQNALKKKCDLDSAKSVSVVHLIRDTFDCVVRLIHDAQEVALLYYRDECKRLKKVRDGSSKGGQLTVLTSAPNPKLLLARHQFKIGYFYEVRGKVGEAVQHYREAYDLLKKCALATTGQQAPQASPAPATFSGQPESLSGHTPQRIVHHSASSAPSAPMHNFGSSASPAAPAVCAGLPALCEIKSALEVVVFRLAFLTMLHNASGVCIVDGGAPDDLIDAEGRLSEKVRRFVLFFRDHMEWFRTVGCGGGQGYASAASDVKSSGGSSGGGGRMMNRLLHGRADEGLGMGMVSEMNAFASAPRFVALAHYTMVARQHETFHWVLTALTAGRVVNKYDKHNVDAYANPGFHLQSASGAALSLAVLYEGLSARGSAGDKPAVKVPLFLGQSCCDSDDASERYLSELARTAEGRAEPLEEVLRLSGNAKQCFEGSASRGNMALSVVGAKSLLALGKPDEALQAIEVAAKYFSAKPWPGVAETVFRIQMHCWMLLGSPQPFCRAFFDYVSQCTAGPAQPLPADFFVLGLTSQKSFFDAVVACFKKQALPADPPSTPQLVPQVFVPSELRDFLTTKPQTIHENLLEDSDETSREDAVLDLRVEATHPFVSQLAHFSSPLAYVTDVNCALKVRVSTQLAHKVPVDKVLVQLAHGGQVFEDMPEGTHITKGHDIVLTFAINPKDVGVIRVASITTYIGILRVTRKVGECPELVNKLHQLSERAGAVGPGGLPSLWAEHCAIPLVQGNVGTTDSGCIAQSNALSGGYGTAASSPYGATRSPFLDRPVLRVLKPQPTLTLTLTHQSPALLSEAYPICITLNAGDAGARAATIMLPGSQHYEVVSVYEGAPIAGNETQADRTAIEHNANRDTATELFEGRGGGVVSTDFRVGRDLGVGEVWTCTVVVTYKTAGEYLQQVIAHYETDASKEMAVVCPLELCVVMPYDLSVTACDGIVWRIEDSAEAPPEAVSEHLVQNPYHCASYLVRSNIPDTRDTSRSPGRDASPASASPSPGSHFTEMTRLGVSSSHPQMVPYTSSCLKASDAPLRQGEEFFLTITLTSTVHTFDLEVVGVQVNYAGRDVVVVRPPPAFEGGHVSLGQGEEVSLTWVLRPVLSAAVKGVLRGGVLIFARRSGAPEGSVPTCFSSDLPPFTVVAPTLIPKIGFPGQASTGDVLKLTVYLTNPSRNKVQKVSCEAKDADGLMTDRKFLWSGRSSLTASILPNSTAKLQYHLVPVHPGIIALPTFSITSEASDVAVLSLADIASVFIKPANSAFKVCKSGR